MGLFEIKSLSADHTLENAAEDYRSAQKVAQYRVSNQAVYVPAFPGSRYVPFSAVTKAFSKNSSLPLTGTCGKAIPVLKVRVFYDGEFYQELLLEKRPDADLVLDRIAAARPDVPIERETRKFELF